MGFEHTFSHRREVRLPPLGDDDRLVMMIAPPPQPPPSPPPPHNDDGEIATPHHVTTMNFFGFLFWMLFGVLQYSLDAVRSVLGPRGMKRCVGVSLLLLLGRVVVGVAERGAISALERVDWGSPPCAEGVPMMTATTATTTTRVVEVEVPWGTPESVVEKKEEVNWWDMTTLDKIDTALGWRPPV